MRKKLQNFVQNLMQKEIQQTKTIFFHLEISIASREKSKMKIRNRLGIQKRKIQYHQSPALATLILQLKTKFCEPNFLNHSYLILYLSFLNFHMNSFKLIHQISQILIQSIQDRVNQLDYRKFQQMNPTLKVEKAEAIRNFRESIKMNLKLKVKKAVSNPQQRSKENSETMKKKRFTSLAEVRSSKDKVIEEDFDYYFQQIKKIGEGCHSVVYSCLNKSSLEKFAVKITRKKDLEHFQDIRESFLTLKKLSHPNILRPDFLFMNQNLMTCHLVSQLCQYSDLKNYLTLHHPLRVQEIAYILEEIIATLDYIHSRGVCHRDIKPDNILYDQKSKKIKIIDFQLCRMARYVHEPLEMMSKTGPLSYRAPETFIKHIYTQKIDIWATGIMAYELFTGKLPFSSKYQKEKIEKICEEEPDYDLIPAEARSLLKGLLRKNPKERISAHEALHSTFFLLHSETPHSLKNKSHNYKSLILIDQEIQVHRHHKKSYDTDCTEQFQGDFEGEEKVIRSEKKTP